MVKYIGVYNSNGELELFDIFVNGKWIGSGRTLIYATNRAKEYLRGKHG